MIRAEKARQIAERSNHNLFDEQIRTLFECIEESAKEGNFSFSFTNTNCDNFGLDVSFWFTGAKLNDSSWIKGNQILRDQGYVVSYFANTIDRFMISIFW